jgi:hypothetical protein
MLSSYRSKIEQELRDLRYGSASQRPFQFGYVSGLLGAYLHADAISFPEYDALQRLKNNAWEHNQAMHSQPGQQAPIKPL